MLALAWPVAASDDAPGTLRIGGDANYPPYQFIDEDGHADGFDVALARAVADDLGLEPRIELGEWDDTLDRLTRGELDLVPMFWSAEREQHYLFTQPFLIRHHALFGRRGQPELESLDELANVRVAVQRAGLRSEDHTSDLQSLMRTSYAVFCLNKKKHDVQIVNSNHMTYTKTTHK